MKRFCPDCGAEFSMSTKHISYVVCTNGHEWKHSTAGYWEAFERIKIPEEVSKWQKYLSTP